MKKNWDSQVKPQVLKKFKQLGFPPSYHQYQQHRQHQRHDDDDEDDVFEPIRSTKPKQSTKVTKSKGMKTKKRRRSSQFIDSDEEIEEDEDEDDDEESFHSSDDEAQKVPLKSVTEKIFSQTNTPVKRKAASAAAAYIGEAAADDDDIGEDDSDDEDRLYKKKKRKLQKLQQERSKESPTRLLPSLPTTANKPLSVASTDGLVKRNNVDLELLEANLRASWEEISALDPNLWFALPVTDDIAPGYSKEIKNPMAMSTMIKRVNAHYYKSVDDFDKDMKLMVNNCERFNTSQDPVTKLAKKMLKAWQKEKKRIENELSTAAGTSTQSNDISVSEQPPTAKPSQPPPNVEPSTVGVVNAPAAVAVSAVTEKSSKEYSKEELPDILSECLQWLTDHDSLGLFAYAADSLSLEADVKMDLSTIRIKVERGKYRNLPSATAIDAIDNDVQNMVKSVLSLCRERTKREVCMCI